MSQPWDYDQNGKGNKFKYVLRLKHIVTSDKI
jgi:hypothetical protein